MEKQQLLEKWPLISALFINGLLALLVHFILKTEPVPDFSKIESITERKQLFFSYINQQVASINSHIAEEREKLIQLQNKQTLDHSEKRFAHSLARKYKLVLNSQLLQRQTRDEFIQQLLSRVDQIPPALVLAQAANESAWGTSRFARSANNYFGIWCFSKGCGVIPQSRGAGKTHEVRRFNSVKDSIRYYIHLLNSHNTYRKLRTIRAASRANGTTVSAKKMATGLVNYSERGEEYVRELISMIEYNKLSEKYPLNSF